MKKNRFRLPKSKTIRLLDQTFKIKFSDLKKEDEDQRGEIVLEKGIINLDNSLKDKPDELEYVMWHEIFHMIADYLDILDDEIFSSVMGKFVIGLNKQLGYKQR